eukprot:g48515.t1
MKQYELVNKVTSLPDVLNGFYAQFEQNASNAVMHAPIAPDTPVPFATASDIRSVLLGVNPRKATGPKGVPGQALRSCVDQLAEVFTDTFNLSLLQAEVPTCLKKTTIIPVLKKTHAVKTIELIIDFRKKEGKHAPIYINRTEVERMKNIKFLGVKITDNLFWTFQVDAIVKKAQQHLFVLRRLRKFGMSIRSLTYFWKCTIESILSGCIMAWYGYCSGQDHKKLQKVVGIANLPSMDSIYMACCCGKAANTIKHPSQP